MTAKEFVAMVAHLTIDNQEVFDPDNDDNEIGGADAINALVDLIQYARAIEKGEE